MAEVLKRLYPWNWIPYLVLAGFSLWFVFDRYLPVVRAQGVLLSQAADSVVIALSGKKLRECRYAGLQAYSRMPDGTMRDASIKRIDQPAGGLTRPVGKFDMGQWDIRPTDGAAAVVVFVQHSCRANDLRSTKMADVRIKP